MTASVIVVIDEARDLGFKITGQVVVLAQNAVLERVVPALNLALGLGMARSTANMGQAAVLQPFGEVTRDAALSIVPEQSWFMRDLGAVAA